MAILAGIFGGMHGVWLAVFDLGVLLIWIVVGEKYIRRLRRRRHG